MTETTTPVWNYAEYSQIAASTCVARALELGFLHETQEGWASDAREYSGEGNLISSYSSPYSTYSAVEFVRRPQNIEVVGIAKIVAEGGNVNVFVWTAKKEDGPPLIAKVKEVMPQTESRSGMIPVTFWYWSAHGPANSVRTIPVPTWQEIEENYPEPTRGNVSDLMEKRIDVQGGQLLLWQGEPGTGKTYAIRAMMDSWREWADFHFIVDPDTFFGDHTDYMMQVLLQEDGGSLLSVGPGRESVEPEKKDPRWKILVLEDSGELLAADARQRVGQGLSRLLNVVDGIIGQGLRVLILITTNEELRVLHPAIQRPGRCASQISFESFSLEQGRDWIRNRDGDPGEVTKELNLSWLYAILYGSHKQEELSVGFGLGSL